MCLLSSAICLQIYEVLGVFKSILHKAHSALMTTNTQHLAEPLSRNLSCHRVNILQITTQSGKTCASPMGSGFLHVRSCSNDPSSCSSEMHCTYSTYRASQLHQVSSRSPVESSRSVFISRQHWGLDARVSRMLAKCPATELQPQAQLYFNIGCNSALREKG